ncbi:hypothetical protein [Nonomuraea dietziae]|uniref:hypothetical protein n=1 Tax=Nonomuraea dietziae TaxID=65515 RepID=UPI0031D2431A
MLSSPGTGSGCPASSPVPSGPPTTTISSPSFGLTIEATGPNFGSDALLDTIADTPALATFMGEQTRLVWPADHGLRRIPVTDPTPVYPHALLWRRDNPHPGMATLRAHLAATAAGHDAAGTWAPGWVIPR